jgi:hypothetical protein
VGTRGRSRTMSTVKCSPRHTPLSWMNSSPQGTAITEGCQKVWECQTERKFALCFRYSTLIPKLPSHP